MINLPKLKSKICPNLIYRTNRHCMENFKIIRSFYDHRPRLLQITQTRIIYENSDVKNNRFTEIKRDEIIGLRHGIQFIKGFEFTIGRTYVIFIKKNDGKELKIDFKLFYGRKLQKKHQLFCEIIDTLWKHYFSDLKNSLLEKYKNGESFEIAKVTVFANKISFNKNEIFISDLSLKRYHHYFVLYSKQKQNNNKMLYYLEDDDAVILLEILTEIIKKYDQS